MVIEEVGDIGRAGCEFELYSKCKNNSRKGF